MINDKWKLTNYQKERLISSTKIFIKQKLDDIHKELEYTNAFIFDFIKDI